MIINDNKGYIIIIICYICYSGNKLKKVQFDDLINSFKWWIELEKTNHKHEM